ncbi:phosphonate C-P lyase system protein PhnG [Algicella marina]|uniref:Phosphonate C-P lyase system protein PhnG n=1 Tax=Algicella marina TaxID=2683284 RepID=A0A6P1T1R8_9RHOB|nr:phosphonate C-P lyase system protein PhnG [Algicella marina]QHQ35681.1 phosphonate C-P lyase system protein PhnG [Algicella marina]
MDGTPDPNAARKAWMSLLAKAPAVAVKQAWAHYGDVPEHSVLRAPEIGGVMVRGRAGAVGAPFNLGEMTVTRASVRLEEGAVGHGYVQGRDRDKALIAALVDALMQTDAAARLETMVLEPLRGELRKKADHRAAKAAATKVDFFTLVRGED